MLLYPAPPPPPPLVPTTVVVAFPVPPAPPIKVWNTDVVVAPEPLRGLVPVLTFPPLPPLAVAIGVELKNEMPPAFPLAPDTPVPPSPTVTLITAKAVTFTSTILL